MIAAAIGGTVIGGTPLGDDATAILQAVMHAVDPVAWIERNVAPVGAGVRIGEHVLAPDAHGVLRILGIGKAAPRMVAALLERIGEHVDEALAIGKHAEASTHPRLTLRRAGHPLPDDDSVAAGLAALELAARTGPRDRLLAVITGGASALAVAPLVSLDDLRTSGELLARAGVPIGALNAVRGALDQIKHGGLARAAHGRALALVLDDIPGGDRFAVGSGPLHVGPPPEISEDMLARLPAAVREALRAAVPGTACGSVEHVVVADNELAVSAAITAAHLRGYTVERAPLLRGEARERGHELGLRARADHDRPFAIVCGGECTVTRHGGGRGGRTLELAISAADAIAGLDDVAVLAFATDGDDGSSGAAGAIVDGSTFARAGAHAIDLRAALRTHDSATALARLGDLLVLGPTGTNVCDVVVVLAR